MKTSILTILALALAAMVCSTVANAGQVTLAWDANDPAPTGYRIYQRTGQIYGPDPVWEGTDTTCTISVPDGVEVAFVARAYVVGTITGQVYESENSNEVILTPAVDTPRNLFLQGLDKIAEGIWLLRQAVLAN